VFDLLNLIISFMKHALLIHLGVKALHFPFVFFAIHFSGDSDCAAYISDLNFLNIRLIKTNKTMTIR